MSALLDIRAPVLADTPGEWEPVDAETLASLRTPTGILTPTQYAALRRIWGRRWFLLRADTGLVSRCRRCNQVHPYVTLGCIPRPYNGLTEVVGIWERVDARDRVIEAIALGEIVPITRADALKLYEQIRAKGYEL